MCGGSYAFASKYRGPKQIHVVAFVYDVDEKESSKNRRDMVQLSTRGQLPVKSTTEEIVDGPSQTLDRIRVLCGD